jgi:hypothetical protein
MYNFAVFGAAFDQMIFTFNHLNAQLILVFNKILCPMLKKFTSIKSMVCEKQQLK